MTTCSCHDPHRVDAILAAALDRLAELHEADHANAHPDIPALAEALEFAVDRRALLGLALDDDAASAAYDAGTAVGNVLATDSFTAGCGMGVPLAVIGPVVAVRLATTAIAIRLDQATHDSAVLLWRAAETLTGMPAAAPVSRPAERCPECDLADGEHKMSCGSGGKRQVVLSADLRDAAATKGAIDSIVNFFAAAGVPCEVTATATDLHPRIGKPSRGQAQALENMGKHAGLGRVQPPPHVVARTEGPRKIVITYPDGRNFALRYSVGGEDD